MIPSVPLNGSWKGSGRQFVSSFRDCDAQPMTGDWKLIWDDQVDGVMSESHHQCDVRFKQINNTIGGDFIGPVAGRERDALIQRKVTDAGSNQLLVFQQHGQGYNCSYQINLGTGIGTWVDTQGRTGDFQLLKFQ